MMKISKICLSRIPKPWTACQFGGKIPLTFDNLVHTIVLPAMLFLQGYQEHKKGKAAFSFVVTVVARTRKGSCLQAGETLQFEFSTLVYTIVLPAMLLFFKGNRKALGNSRKLVPRVNCISYFMFRVLDHSSLKRAYKKLYLISLHRFYSFTILWTFEKKLCCH